MATPRNRKTRGPMREIVATWTADGEKFERLACGHEAHAKRDCVGRYTSAKRRHCSECAEPTDEFAMRPARNLRRLRLEAGLTETALGLLVWPDLEPATARGRIGDTARGKWPMAARVQQLADALGVDPSAFYQPLD